MLYNQAKGVTYSAMAGIESVNESGNTVVNPMVYYSANITSKGSVTINQSIANVNLYLANQDIVTAAYSEFLAEVNSLLSDVTTTA